MYLKRIFVILSILSGPLLYGQTLVLNKDTSKLLIQSANSGTAAWQFMATADFMDVAIGSFNSLNALVRKENYRIRIISLNNPTSSDLGFTLVNEVQAALKPLLAKAKNTNATKFSQVVSGIVDNQSRNAFAGTVLGSISPAFTTILSLVGTLAIQEKKITKEDLDSFLNATSKYFIQYEKLNQANLYFDQQILRLQTKMEELQLDMKEFVLDLIIISSHQQTGQLRSLSMEELYLRFLDKYRTKFIALDEKVNYPSYAMKTVKDIASTIQKLFNEYQLVYSENYQQIRNILLESKTLGKNINNKQVEISLSELQGLYSESHNSDVLSLRLNILGERLKTLGEAEQGIIK